MIRNVNPFLHQYRITGTITTYTESAIAEFAKVALGLTITAPPLPARAPFGAQLAKTDARCAADTAKKAADAIALGIIKSANYIDSLGKAINQHVRRVATHDTDFVSRTSGARTVLGDPTRDSLLIAMAVKALDTADESYLRELKLDSDRVSDSVRAYNTAVAEFATRNLAWQAKYPSCALFADYYALAIRWVADTAFYRGATTHLAARLSEVTVEFAAVDRVHKNPSLLQITREIGGYDESTVVDVVVQRSPVGADTAWRTIANPRFFFGEPRRFAIGAGLLTASIPSAEYSVIHRYNASPAGPGDTIETVVGRSREAWMQVLPTVVLSARLRRIPTTPVDGIHFVIGGAPRTDQSKFTLDYLAGFALSGFDERAFVSLGIVTGERRELAGVVENGKLPASQPSVPTKKTWTTGYGAALTFRVF